MMNDVLARIQEISERIRQIRSLAYTPPSDGPTQPAAGAGAPLAAGSAAASPADSAAFQQLLVQALTAGLGTEGEAGSLLGDLTSAVSASSGATGATAADSTRLYEYQRQLIDAIRQLSEETQKR